MDTLLVNDRIQYRLRGQVADTEEQWPLPQGVHQIGSERSADLVLRHDGVSRRHALLIVEARQVVVVDLGSKNGTYLNGKRLRRGELELGDTLSIGPVQLVLEAMESGDDRLALEMTPHVGGQQLTTGGDTTFSGRWHTTRLVPHQWLELLRIFAAQVTEDPTALAPALGVVRRGLEVAAVGLWIRADGDRPALLAADGEVQAVPLEAALETLDTLWRHRRDGDLDFFVSREDFTGWIRGGSTKPQGLVVVGDFPGREVSEHLLATLFQLMAPSGGEARSPTATSRPRDLRFPPDYVVGRSAAMRALYRQMKPLIQGDLPVLIVGETGVGKEPLATILHRSSLRSGGPLVAINCAAIPAELLEAELFGIGDRVATGVAGRVGKFQQAQAGTLFLDEIGEMPNDLQAKLLRALQEGEVHPVGGKSTAIDVRLLAATNVDLATRMEAGEFRRDLFYRLAGFILKAPPLRTCREDIPALVEHFLRTVSKQAGKKVRGLTVRALEILQSYDWPGNIRELEHEVRRLVYLCPENQAIDGSMPMERIRTPSRSGLPAGLSLEQSDEEATQVLPSLPTPGPEPFPASALPVLELEELERRAVAQALLRADGNRAHAATLLGISRHSLRRRIERYRQASTPSEDG